MQAIELKANITPDHELHLMVPDHAPAGPARVIVLLESDSPLPARGGLDDFLARLPSNTTGGISHAQIIERVEGERSAWGEL